MQSNKFYVVDRGTVDDQPWVVARVFLSECETWIRQQPQQQWYQHGYTQIGALFDLDEKLYTMMCLKWS